MSDRYMPFVGKTADGEEVLVTLQFMGDSLGEWPHLASVEVAFRGEWDRMWSPPVQCQPAP